MFNELATLSETVEEEIKVGDFVQMIDPIGVIYREGRELRNSDWSKGAIIPNKVTEIKEIEGDKYVKVGGTSLYLVSHLKKYIKK